VTALPIGLLGVSHVHAPGYARRLRDGGYARLVGFVEGEDGLAARFREETGAQRFADVGALKAAGARAVVVAGDNRERLPALEDALAAGLPALAEKPLGLVPAESAALLAAFARAGVTLATAFPMRFAPSVTALVEGVREKAAIGRLVALVGENVARYPGGWFGDPARSGGGCLTDHTAHVADIFARLTTARPLRVTCLSGATLPSGAERGALLLIEYADGVYGSLDASWARPGSYPAWGGLSVLAVGERGTLEARPFAERFTLWGEPALWVDAGDDLDDAMLRDFASAAGTGRAARASGLDGLRALCLQAAAQRSMVEGEAVPVEDPVLP
jgi:1,5-anhydro-D-fructose reductase (1,5-anhydro-D-mannitol-forming)